MVISEYRKIRVVRVKSSSRTVRIVRLAGAACERRGGRGPSCHEEWGSFSVGFVILSLGFVCFSCECEYVIENAALRKIS